MPQTPRYAAPAHAGHCGVPSFSESSSNEEYRIPSQRLLTALSFLQGTIVLGFAKSRGVHPGDHMQFILRLVTTSTVMLALAPTPWVAPSVWAAEATPIVRKAVKKVCTGPHCGPYAPCEGRCRVICPDGYSCRSLYGAYGPYGGVPYWGSYTLSGWGWR